MPLEPGSEGISLVDGGFELPRHPDRIDFAVIQDYARRLPPAPAGKLGLVNQLNERAAGLSPHRRVAEVTESSEIELLHREATLPTKLLRTGLYPGLPPEILAQLDSLPTDQPTRLQLSFGYQAGLHTVDQLLDRIIRAGLPVDISPELEVEYYDMLGHSLDQLNRLGISTHNALHLTVSLAGLEINVAVPMRIPPQAVMDNAELIDRLVVHELLEFDLSHDRQMVDLRDHQGLVSLTRTLLPQLQR